MIDLELEMVEKWGENGSRLTDEECFEFLGEPPKYEDLPKWLKCNDEDSENLKSIPVKKSITIQKPTLPATVKKSITNLTSNSRKIACSNAMNFLLREIKLPIFSAKQEALIDIIFDKLLNLIPRMTEKEKSLITQENFEMVLANRDAYPDSLHTLEFFGNEIRKILGRYPEKQILKDFQVLSAKTFQIKGEKIWYGKDGKYHSIEKFTERILTRIHESKISIVNRTKEPIYRITAPLNFCLGLLWLNQILNKKYRLFPPKFYKLPAQCQKIYRYLCLYPGTTLTFDKAIQILQLKSNDRQQKKRIERILQRLRTTKMDETGSFLYSWNSVENKKGIQSAWKIKRRTISLQKNTRSFPKNTRLSQIPSRNQEG